MRMTMPFFPTGATQTHMTSVHQMTPNGMLRKYGPIAMRWRWRSSPWLDLRRGRGDSGTLSQPARGTKEREGNVRHHLVKWKLAAESTDRLRGRTAELYTPPRIPGGFLVLLEDSYHSWRIPGGFPLFLEEFLIVMLYIILTGFLS